MVPPRVFSSYSLLSWFCCIGASLYLFWGGLYNRFVGLAIANFRVDYSMLEVILLLYGPGGLVWLFGWVVFVWLSLLLVVGFAWVCWWCGFLVWSLDCGCF